MNAKSAKQVLLIRAIEETDTEHEILDRTALDRATAEARQDNATGEAILSRRAAILCEQLKSKHAALRPVISNVNDAYTAFAVIAAAVVVWLLVSDVSKGLWAAGDSINILIVPLLLLFVWNLLSLTVKCVFFIVSLVRRDAERPTLLDRAMETFSSLRLTLLNRVSEQLASHESEKAARWRTALTKFAASWVKLARPLYGARIRFALHVAACALVAGEFFYVYVRGIAVQFNATWQSTWFSAETTHALLATLLWPAWSLLGDALPSAEEIAQLRTHESSAAYWINLYFVQACIVVFVPRLFLSTIQGIRAVRLESALPLALDDRYYQNLIHADRGQGTVARVVPYSFSSSTKTRDTLHDLLAEQLGHAAHVEIEDSIPYGVVERPARESASDAEPIERCVLLFNLAQTPEREVHGRFIASFAHTTEEQLALVIDATAYSDRLRGEPERATRLADRRAAWQNLAAEHGIIPLFLGLDSDNTINWR